MRSELLKHQVGGDHYKKGVQPWEAIVKFNLTFFEGNALKYIVRRKGDRKQDLEKAVHYLDACIDQRKFWRHWFRVDTQTWAEAFNEAFDLDFREYRAVQMLLLNNPKEARTAISYLLENNYG
jgi:hypothetical protein